MTNSQMEEASLRLAEEWFLRSPMHNLAVAGDDGAQEMVKRMLIKSVKAAIHRGMKEYKSSVATVSPRAASKSEHAGTRTADKSVEYSSRSKA